MMSGGTDKTNCRTKGDAGKERNEKREKRRVGGGEGPLDGGKTAISHHAAQDICARTRSDGEKSVSPPPAVGGMGRYKGR